MTIKYLTVGPKWEAYIDEELKKGPYRVKTQLIKAALECYKAQQEKPNTVEASIVLEEIQHKLKRLEHLLSPKPKTTNFTYQVDYSDRLLGGSYLTSKH